MPYTLGVLKNLEHIFSQIRGRLRVFSKLRAHGASAQASEARVSRVPAPNEAEPIKKWDYSLQAQHYKFRPNYAPAAIDALTEPVGARDAPQYRVADIGAGTGNLTLLLLERGLRCIAVEPNKAMREIGTARTAGMAVEWKVGTGENTGLASESVNWFVMGSSFNTTDRGKSLREAVRVLKSGGYFTCMWNHREIERDPVQRRIEEIIMDFIPSYERGARREDQTSVIQKSGLFEDVRFLEVPKDIEQPLQAYIEAWKSVKNSYWDLETEEGRTLFSKITEKMIAEFGDHKVLKMTYITRAWTARKKT